MKSNRRKCIWRALAGLVPALAMVLGAGILPAAAKSSKREVARGGLSAAEMVAAQQRLHREVSPQVPDRVSNAPVWVDITEEDRSRLAEPTNRGYEPLRVGVVKRVPTVLGKPAGEPFMGGVMDQRPDGSFTWAVRIVSRGAQAVRVHFQEFMLPADTEMFLLGDNGQAHGPYTGQGRNGDGDFWTRSVASDTATILLRYTGSTPGTARPIISFVISDVGHIRGRPPRPQERNHDSWPCSDNAPCLVDKNCVNTGPAGPAEDAVAKMEWIQGPFIYTCTGGLLADTDTGSQINYFLTANHCLSSSNSSMETFFNYETTSCNGSCPDSLVTGGTPPPASTVGYTVLRSGSAGDYTLGTLDQNPPAGAVFLPWNNSPIASTGGAHLYRISNANFGPQVYSQHDVDPTSPQCTGWPRGERIYSVDQTGATMGGSSGSPVVNSAGQVVGQLSGCCGFNCGDECDAANNWTVDGALAFYWGDVSDLLDPPTGGCTTDAECDDGLFCTGTETCVSGTCQSSGDPCTGGTVCNEATDTCEAPACNNDGICGPGEDCNNCPNDCGSKINGNPSSRYCCDGDIAPDCGDPRCSEGGFICGAGGPCTVDADCDDGQFCNGAEVCTGGICTAGSDPCPGQGCDEGSDQCVVCGGNKAPCSTNSDCCSGNCKNGTCKGN